MMKRPRMIITVLIVLSVILCVQKYVTAAGPGTPLQKQIKVEFAAVATSKVYIAWSDACKDGDGFVVTGVLRRRDTVGLPIKSHVDITIQSPGGTIINEPHSSDVFVARHIAGRGQNLQRFRVRFPSIPTEGSKISIVTHSGYHKNTENNSNS